MKEKAIVEDIYTKSESINVPTLINFQNGTLLTNRKEHTLFTKLRGKHDDKTALVIVNDQVYQGRIHDTDELTDLYICVRNKSTNKVRILPIDQVQLHNSIFNTIEEIKKTDLSEEDKYKTLVLQFGGRKQARYIKSQQQMKMDIDLMKENLDNTIQETSLVDIEPENSIKYLDSIRVKFNPDATKLENIYNINDIMSEDLLDCLDPEANALLTTDIKKIPIKSVYLLNCLEKLKSSDNPTNSTLTKIKMIIYMDALHNLILTRERNMNKIELSSITEKVENYIREQFGDKNAMGNKRTAFTAEKALCHFIVLALLLSDKYQIQIKTLQDELKVIRSKIIKFGHIVNAISKVNSTVLSLRLPSKVPPLTAAFNRRKPKP